jgi:hypothetical protein
MAKQVLFSNYKAKVKEVVRDFLSEAGKWGEMISKGICF